MAFGSALSASDDSPLARKARGAFFTPSSLTDYICGWAIRDKADRVLEPACGEAEFLCSAAKRLSKLGADEDLIGDSLVGIELHKASIECAGRRVADEGFGCTFLQQDFLTSDFAGRFDAVIGNPPYVRFQSISPAQKEACKRIAGKSGVEISALSSLWVPFVIESALSLKVGGRMGLVLPSELLSVNYAAAVRKFLLSSFPLLQLVTFEQRVFPEVQEEVVVLLADGFAKGSSTRIEWLQCSSIADLGRVAPVEYVPESPESRWSGLFATAGSVSLLDEFIKAGSFSPLSEWGRVSLGAVTGNNRFFSLTDEGMKENGFSADDVIDLCPPGSQHLRRLSLSEVDLDRLSAAGKATHLFCPKTSDLSSAARRYIGKGEAAGVCRGYKCQKRNPWWKVPVPAPPDAFVTYMNAFGPNICWNAAKVANLNSCHGLYLRGDLQCVDPSLLSIAALNSITMFGAEMVGRSYGGGLLKLEPREAARLPVPSVALVESAAAELSSIRRYVGDALERKDFETAVAVVDAVLASKTGRGDDFVQLGSNAALMRLRRSKRAKKAVYR